MDYVVKWTDVAMAKRAAAEISGMTITLAEFALGDGDGDLIDPDGTETELVGEVWRGDVNSVSLTDQLNEIKVTTVLPITEGPFTIREFGIFDSEGDLAVIGQYPVTEKPIIAESVSTGISIAVILEMSNSATIEITIDGSGVLVTQEDLDNHNTDPDAHEQLVKNLMEEVRSEAFFLTNCLSCQ